MAFTSSIGDIFLQSCTTLLYQLYLLYFFCTLQAILLSPLPDIFRQSTRLSYITLIRILSSTPDIFSLIFLTMHTFSYIFHFIFGCLTASGIIIPPPAMHPPQPNTDIYKKFPTYFPLFLFTFLYSVLQLTWSAYYDISYRKFCRCKYFLILFRSNILRNAFFHTIFFTDFHDKSYYPRQLPFPYGRHKKYHGS